MLPLLLVPALVVSLAQPDPAASLARPTAAQAAWADREVTMFIHIAPQTWQDSEWDTLQTPLTAINPENLDTNQWADAALAMGATAIIFVAKHEGGFCWWPTTTTDWSVANTPWRNGQGDVMADLAKSCESRGLGLGVYLSPQDKKHGVAVGGKSRDPAGQANYEKVFRTQLTELLTNYGSMVEVWFDGSLAFDVGDILAAHAPNAVVFQGPQASIRWVGNEDGTAPYPAWNAVKFGAKKWGDYTAADGDPAGDRWLPNECDARIRATWFWRTDNEKTLKSVDDLVRMYELSVGRGAVLLLNQTPDRSGLIPQSDVDRGKAFADAVQARYGTAAASTSGAGAMEYRITFSSPATIAAFTIAEDITHGERIRAFRIDGLVVGEWKELATGSAVGHKHIAKLSAAASQIPLEGARLVITEAVGEVHIRTFAGHRPVAASTPSQASPK